MKDGEKFLSPERSRKIYSDIFGATFSMDSVTSNKRWNFTCYGYSLSSPQLWSVPSNQLELLVSGKEVQYVLLGIIATDTGSLENTWFVLGDWQPGLLDSMPQNFWYSWSWSIETMDDTIVKSKIHGNVCSLCVLLLLQISLCVRGNCDLLCDIFVTDAPTFFLLLCRDPWQAHHMGWARFCDHLRELCYHLV